MAKQTNRQPSQAKAPTATPRNAANQPPKPLLNKPPEPPTAPRPVKVRALRMCYYDHARRREGDVFYIEGMHHFSKTGAMELVDDGTPEKLTTSAQAIKQAHDEILAGRGGEPTSSDRVLS